MAKKGEQPLFILTHQLPCSCSSSLLPCPTWDGASSWVEVHLLSGTSSQHCVKYSILLQNPECKEIQMEKNPKIQHRKETCIPHPSRGLGVVHLWTDFIYPSHLYKGLGALASLGLQGSSQLPMRHWVAGLSFLWKRAIVLSQAPTAKSGILPPTIGSIRGFLPDESCLYQRLRLALVSWGVLLTCLWDTVVLGFPSCGKEASLLPNWRLNSVS